MSYRLRRQHVHTARQCSRSRKQAQGTLRFLADSTSDNLLLPTSTCPRSSHSFFRWINLDSFESRKNTILDPSPMERENISPLRLHKRQLHYMQAGSMSNNQSVKYLYLLRCQICPHRRSTWSFRNEFYCMLLDFRIVSDTRGSCQIIIRCR